MIVETAMAFIIILVGQTWLLGPFGCGACCYKPRLEWEDGDDGGVSDNTIRFPNSRV